MANTIENWKDDLIIVLKKIAYDYMKDNIRIMNEVMIGDIITSEFPRNYPNSSIMVWPEATWFKKDQESGFFVDRTIMDESKTIYVINDNDNPQKNIIIEKYNKQFFHDDQAIAIELKHLRTNNCPYDDVIKDYKKLHNIQEAMDHRYENNLYKTLNSKTWKGFLVCGCETEKIYLEIKQRLSLEMESIPKNSEHHIFIFGPYRSEFLC